MLTKNDAKVRIVSQPGREGKNNIMTPDRSYLIPYEAAW